MTDDMNTFQCKNCGKKNSRAWSHGMAPKFCDYKCRNEFLGGWRKDKRIHPEVPCIICGKLFTPYSNCKSPCCSMACKLKKGEKKRHRTCAHCGIEFIAYAPAATTKFCSHMCAISRLIKTFEFDCLNCKKHIVYERKGGIRQTRKFCSKDCQYAYSKGENSPLFRGNRRHYRGKNWKSQAQKARDRDRVCQSCGKLGNEKLSVDHIVPFRLAYRYSQKDNNDPNDLVNLISLCRDCHGKKTMLERRLLKGDVIGFKQAMRSLIGDEKTHQALIFWGLDREFVMPDPLSDLPPMPPLKNPTGFNRPLEEIKKMVEARNVGESPKSIAIRFGVSHYTSVCHLISKYKRMYGKEYDMRHHTLGAVAAPILPVGDKKYHE